MHVQCTGNVWNLGEQSDQPYAAAVIVVDVLRVHVADNRGDVQLLLQLPRQAVLQRFALLELAAGELPATRLRLAGGPPRQQHLAVAQGDGSGHRFHAWFLTGTASRREGPIRSRGTRAHDRHPHRLPLRTAGPPALARQPAGRRHRRHRGAAAGHGLRHRQRRQAGTGAVHGHRRRPRGVAVRRQPGADRRAHRRLHRHPRRHHRAVRHRRSADRHLHGRHHAAAARPGAPGQHHQVHSGAGDRGFHRRHRGDHLRRPVARFLRAAGGDRRPLPREAVAPAASAAGAGPGHHPARPARRGAGAVVAEAARAEPRARAADRHGGGDAAAGRVPVPRRGHHRQRLRRHSAEPAVAAGTGNHPGAGDRADRPGLRHRHAGLDRVAAVGGGRRRHGRHPPRLQPGAGRPGHRQHGGAAARRLRRHRCHRAYRHQHPQRRQQPRRRHHPRGHAGAGHPAAGAAGGLDSAHRAGGHPVRDRLEHERAAACVPPAAPGAEDRCRTAADHLRPDRVRRPGDRGQHRRAARRAAVHAPHGRQRGSQRAGRAGAGWRAARAGPGAAARRRAGLRHRRAVLLRRGGASGAQPGRHPHHPGLAGDTSGPGAVHGCHRPAVTGRRGGTPPAQRHPGAGDRGAFAGAAQADPERAGEADRARELPRQRAGRAAGLPGRA
ncbi:UNVERIFIED_CONTAM: hypothetical protein NCL1_01244 [Trichonephila clavipes]